MKAGKLFLLVACVATVGMVLLAHHFVYQLWLGRIGRLEISKVDEGVAPSREPVVTE